MTNHLTYTDLDTDLLAPPGPTSPATPSVAALQPDRPMGNGRRWMLLAGGAAFTATAILGIVVAANDRSDTVDSATEQRSAGAIIQDEIDAALAVMNRATGDSVAPSASAIIQDEIDAALARRDSTVTVQPPAYLIVQNAIDAALAEREGADQRSTAQLVQDEIVAALAAAAATGGGPQRPAYLIVQDEIVAALARLDDTTTD